jgi:hypothetical protein
VFFYGFDLITQAMARLILALTGCAKSVKPVPRRWKTTATRATFSLPFGAEGIRAAALQALAAGVPCSACG